MRLIVVSPQFEQDGPGNKQAFEREVRRSMEQSGYINSASGRSAALAINYCERLGLDYAVRAESGMYFVEQIKKKKK